MKKTLSVLIAFTVLSIACRKEKPTATVKHLAAPELPETTYDYPASANDELATLGRVLFYDKNLSHNNTISCGSCHQQNRGFCDNLTVSQGLTSGNTVRNTPSIFSKSGRLFWDGRAAGIGDLVLRPVRDHVEMGVNNLNALSAKLQSLSYYPALFEKAFYSPDIDTNRIKEALVEFLKNFRFTNNKFLDHLVNKTPLSASEQLGKELFHGKARCGNCHLVEQALFFPFPGDGDVYGGSTNFVTGRNIGLDLNPADKGIGAVTKDPADMGKFVMPVLFNIEYTQPYMHDGRFKTLEEVVEHYNSGVQDHPNLDFNLREIDVFEMMSDEDVLNALDKNGDGEISQQEIAGIPPVRLNLTESEKRHLVAFLKTLSDPAVKTDPRFSDPFVKK